MSEIRGIIFDLDGVIADSHPLHEDAWHTALIEAGCKVTRAQVANAIRAGRTRAEVLRELLPDSPSSEQQLYGQRKDELFARNMGRLRPIAGVLDWIAELTREHVPLAVATSGSGKRAGDTLSQFGIRACFWAVISANDVAAGKPDPALFEAAAARLALQPEDLLVVEDAAAGVLAAQRAGMRCLLYAPLTHEVPAIDPPPDFVISEFSPEQLRRVMTELVAPAAAREQM